AMVFVSHDLALVAEIAHRITVMYAGQVVEQAPTGELLADPRHEYTQGLLGAVLSIEQRSTRLHQIPGTVPSPRDFPTGDRFAPRSSQPDRGLDVRPVLRAVDDDGQHLVAMPPAEPAGAGTAPLTTGGTRRAPPTRPRAPGAAPPATARRPSPSCGTRTSSSRPARARRSARTACTR